MTTTSPVQPTEQTSYEAVAQKVDGSGYMFDRIATRYDLLNRVLSFGIDRSWRRKAVLATGLERGSGARVLDLATGTADLAMELAQSLDATVLGVDPSTAMLDVGRHKLEGDARVELIEGDAQALELADNGFDAATIAFGIRNVPDRAAALREMTRVVKPGGRVVVLELTEPPGGILGWPAKVWVHHAVPRIGALLSGDREYRYLQKSIAAFPPPAEFARLMESCGLDDVRVKNLTFGVACLFVGVVPEPAADTDDGTSETAEPGGKKGSS